MQGVRCWTLCMDAARGLYKGMVVPTGVGANTLEVKVAQRRMLDVSEIQC